MGKIVTFGEIMLRLKSPYGERLLQSDKLEATFGGGEANVAVSCANFGMDTSYVTVLPDNDIAKACVRQLRGFGVNTDDIYYRNGRMGIYFLEPGAVQRPSKVIYDREYSAISLVKPGDIDWKKVFNGASWLHVTGNTHRQRIKEYIENESSINPNFKYNLFRSFTHANISGWKEVL
jgi:2-dehydro-3-deoxygluconokinase